MLNLGVGQIGFKAKSNKHYHHPTGQGAEDLQRSGGLPRDPWVFVISLCSNLKMYWTAIAIKAYGQQNRFRLQQAMVGEFL